MGKVIAFHDARASRGLPAASFSPKRDGSASFLARASACEKAKKFSGGMALRAFQLLTADVPTPAKDAAAALPPTASMMASTVLSIPAEYSRRVNLSTLHELAVDSSQPAGILARMAETAKTIGDRLFMTREALEVKAAELCRRIKCKPNRWSQYESGDRKITLPVANRLCDEYGLTLDWIYRANPAMLPHELRLKMPRIAA